MRKFAVTAISVIGLLSGICSASGMEGVVASIKPIHSLVSGVMEGTGKPELLLKGAASPHSYALKPSDATTLEQAKLIFWIGPEMETFLAKSMTVLAANASVVNLSEIPDLTLLDIRHDDNFAAHSHEDLSDKAHDAVAGDHSKEPDDHEHSHSIGEKDMHLWLDPENARIIVKAIARQLSVLDPDNTTIYLANAKKLDQRLSDLIFSTGQALKPDADKPFFVFHDAYHYFEHRFGLHALGTIVVNPGTPPSAKRVQEIRDQIKQAGAACVFSEPQFDPKIVTVITQATDAKSAVLDPLGFDHTDGPELYFNIINDLTKSFQTCL